jgi:activating signal cointegrator complex subunit 3
LVHFHSYPKLTLPSLKEKCLRNYEALAGPLRAEFEEPQIEQIYKVICELPTIDVGISVRGPYESDMESDRPMPQPLTRDFWMDIYAEQVNHFIHRPFAHFQEPKKYFVLETKI